MTVYVGLISHLCQTRGIFPHRGNHCTGNGAGVFRRNLLVFSMASTKSQVRLLTTPETDAQVLYDRYWQTVVSIVPGRKEKEDSHRSTDGVETVPENCTGKPISFTRCLPVSGLQIAKGDCTMNGTFQVVSPREFPMKLTVFSGQSHRNGFTLLADWPEAFRSTRQETVPKIALEGSFTLSGVFQIAKEEVLAP